MEVKFNNDIRASIIKEGDEFTITFFNTKATIDSNAVFKAAYGIGIAYYRFLDKDEVIINNGVIKGHVADMLPMIFDGLVIPPEDEMGRINLWATSIIERVIEVSK